MFLYHIFFFYCIQSLKARTFLGQIGTLKISRTILQRQIYLLFSLIYLIWICIIIFPFVFVFISIGDDDEYINMFFGFINIRAFINYTLKHSRTPKDLRHARMYHHLKKKSVYEKMDYMTWINRQRRSRHTHAQTKTYNIENIQFMLLVCIIH